MIVLRCIMQATNDMARRQTSEAGRFVKGVDVRMRWAPPPSLPRCPAASETR